MWKRSIRTLVLGALVVGAISCETIESPSPPVEGRLPFTTAETLDSVPLDYGKLVAVTSHGAYPYDAVLWFERADEAIVYVRVNTSVGAINPQILTIPRR